MKRIVIAFAATLLLFACARNIQNETPVTLEYIKIELQTKGYAVDSLLRLFQEMIRAIGGAEAEAQLAQLEKEQKNAGIKEVLVVGTLMKPKAVIIEFYDVMTEDRLEELARDTGENLGALSTLSITVIRGRFVLIVEGREQDEEILTFFKKLPQ